MDVHFGPFDWAKDLTLHLGLGLAWVRLNPQEITTLVHEVSPTRVRVLTQIPLHVTDLVFWCIPVSDLQVLEEEEIATMDGPDSMLIQAHQELAVTGSVRYWHATFHRVKE